MIAITKKQILELAKTFEIEILKISISKRKNTIDIEVSKGWNYWLNYDHPVRQFIIWNINSINSEDSKIWKEYKTNKEKLKAFESALQDLEPSTKQGFEDSDRGFVPNTYLFIS